MVMVLSLGGSLMNTETGIDAKYLEEIKRILDSSENKFGIVTGGGYLARRYANQIRSGGGNEFEADEAAIEATWENAKTLIKVLGKNAYLKVPRSFREAQKGLEKKKYVVMGGTIPGITTDADAVLLAECLEAERVVNISNVDGIYNKDPRQFPDAKKYSYLTHEELVRLAVENDRRMAGTNFVFDLLACKLAERSKLEIHFVNGKKLDDIKNAINGRMHSGTKIK
ncbi:MAG: UMP kinase [Candidatus Micrarchaeia archaeon]